jgi:hypothetical protein
VKLLFDENLGPALVLRLADLFPDSTHAHHAGLSQADDATILLSRVTTMIEHALPSRAQAIDALADDETGIIDVL